MNTHDKIKLPPLPRFQVPLIDADVDLMDIRRLAQWAEGIAKDYAIATAEPYRKALHDLIRDLEMRSNFKRGENKGVVDCGNGVYRQALMALGELK